MIKNVFICFNILLLLIIPSKEVIGKEVIGMEISKIELDNQEYDLRDIKTRADLGKVTEVMPGTDETLYDFAANWSQMTVGLIDQSNGNIIGDSGTGARVSDYIPVTEGTTYTGKNINRTAFYNSSKVYTPAGIDSKFWTGDLWVAPADGYLRLNLTPANMPVAEATIVGVGSLTAIDKVTREVIDESITGIDEVVEIAKPLFDFDTSKMTTGLIQPDGSIGSDAGTGAKVSDYIEVTAGTTYILSGVNRAAYYSLNKSYIKAIPNVYNGIEFVPEQNGYVRLNSTPANLPNSKAMIGRSTAIDNVVRSELSLGKGYVDVSGDLSAGQSLTVAKLNNVKKNNIYAFSGKVTSFSSLKIGHGTNSLYDSYIEITGTSVIVHNRLGSDETVTYNHGLTISGCIKVEILVKDFGTTLGYMDCDISIISSGSEFKQTGVKWLGCGNGAIFVQSVGSALTDCKLTWSSSDFKKKIWIFGDSYVMIPSESRWPYYAHQDGFLDNFLLNGFGGETSVLAVQNLEDMIDLYGKPKYIVWTLGMNDGSDSNGDPSTNWVTGVNTFVKICVKNDITPILATIPTVPSINHEAKNNLVRNNYGYRYIDFAKAVGASSSGQWYTGMLSSDNTHPTVLGAKALYNQVLIDFPELTFDN